MENYELPQPVNPDDLPHKKVKPPQLHKRRFFPVFLTLLLMLTTAVGTWYIMEFHFANRPTSQNSTSSTDLETLKSRQLDTQAKLTEAQKKVEELTAGTALPEDIATGQATADLNDPMAVAVTLLVRPNTVQELWLEFGPKPNSLVKQTPHVTNGFGLADNQGYGSYAVVIPASELTPGETYFYRAAAAQDGVRIHGGVAAFIAPK